MELLGNIAGALGTILALYVLFSILVPTARGAGTAGVKGSLKYLAAVLLVIWVGSRLIPFVIDDSFLSLERWGYKSPITNRVLGFVGMNEGYSGEGVGLQEALSFGNSGMTMGGATAQQSAAIDPVTGQAVAQGSIPAEPQVQYVLIGDPANQADLPLFKQCYLTWFTSPVINGPARLSQGMPPEGGASATEWWPSGTGSATLEVETPAGFGNNHGTLSHWLFPNPFELNQDALKAIADDGKGIYEVQPTGAWPPTCYREVQPTVEAPSTTEAPPANDGQSGGGGPVVQYWPPRDEGTLASEWLLYAMDGVTVNRSIPAGSPLQSCGQQGEFLFSCQGGQPGSELFRDPTP